jgi:ATP-binding cassette subfamily F protein 3
VSILTFSNLAQSFGAVDIFSGLTGSVANDGKIGLVGPNGVGKTSLLLILAGQTQPTAGSVHIARGRRLGYLPQEAMQAFAEHDNSIYQEMLTVFAGLRAQEARLHELAERMGQESPSEELLEQYSAAQEQFELAGGYEYEGRIKYVLIGLGFKQAQWELPLSQLSGGQKTRALLARLLLEKPDLLIMDEPTNHLDIEAVEWLENTLRSWDGGLLVVSHDRYFLDKVVNTIWEMSPASLESYRGNYSAYVKQRQERWERNEQLFTQEKERMEQDLEFIRRNIAGQGTDQAKGRLRRLSRQIVAIEKYGVAGIQGKSWSELGIDAVTMMTVGEASLRLGALRSPVSRPPELNLKLHAAQRSGDIVLRTTDLQVGYSGTALFRTDDIELRRLECAALIGPNGAGKTTFLRTILGQLPPVAGEVRLGASLKVGYFSQAHGELDPEKTLLDQLLSHRNMPPGEARSYLAQYLFREDDVWKQVKSLSGGERGRLALAILALKGANFLLLDEPTNHLDIPAQEVLQEVLEHFEGTILLVSHDRYLVDHLATQVWELRAGLLYVFHGPYNDFLAARAAATEVIKETVKRTAAPAVAADRVKQRAARKQAEALVAIEEQITKLEATLARLTNDLQAASEAQDFDRIQRLSAAYSQAQTELEEAMGTWEALAEGVA